MPSLFDIADAAETTTLIKEISSGDCIKVISLNVQSAGSARFESIFKYLKEQDADLVILSEIKDKIPTLDFLEIMSLNGYEDCVLNQAEPKAFHTVILRRVSGLSLKIETETLKSRAAITKIFIDDRELYFVGLYPPAFGTQNLKIRRTFFEDLEVKVLKRLCSGDRRIIIAGDLNIVEKVFHSHLPSEIKESSSYFDILERFGFVDVLRRHHADKPMFTWISPQTGEGQRLDHVFSTSNISSWVTDIQVDDTPRRTGLSDHSALKIGIQIPYPT